MPAVGMKAQDIEARAAPKWRPLPARGPLA